MSIQTTKSSSNTISSTLGLAEFMVHYRLPNGGYATDLATAVYALKDAHMELAKLSCLTGKLSSKQEAIRAWAIQTIGECNKVLLGHAERYPYLFEKGQHYSRQL